MSKLRLRFGFARTREKLSKSMSQNDQPQCSNSAISTWPILAFSSENDRRDI